MFNKEVAALRRLADAIERRDTVFKYISEYGNQVAADLTVDWNAAASCEGFADTKALAIKHMREAWPIVASNIRVELSTAVDNARRDVDRLSAAFASVPAGD